MRLESTQSHCAPCVFPVVCRASVVLRVLGEGTFGRVYLARHLASSSLVALKKVRIRRAEEGLPKVLMREIQALEKLGAEGGGGGLSRHVVRLREHFAQGSAVVLVLEYMQADLHQVMQAMAVIGQRISTRAVQACMRQILTGVAGVHQQQVMHRDLKPSNLLFSPSGRLKLGDFGLARVHLLNGVSDPNYSHEVATRWYRPPELLFGSRSYDGFAVDVWAVGATLAELLNGAPLFPGHNDIDQLYRVLALRGTPTPDNWPRATELPDYNKIAFPHMEPVPLASVCHAEVGAEAIDLLDRMLALDPARRITARDALKHPFLRRRRAEEGGTETETQTEEEVEAQDEDIMRELAALPAVVKQWQQRQTSGVEANASGVAGPSVSTAKPSAPANGTATAAASSAASTTAATLSVDPLRSLHLTGIQWAPSNARAFSRALEQLPSISQVTSSGRGPSHSLLQPVRIDDLCPC